MRLATIASLWLAGCATVLAAPHKQVRDFEVDCTNSLTCEIWTASKDANEPQLYAVSFRRKSGPDTPLDLRLSVKRPLKSDSELGFAVDGKPVAAVPLARFRYDPVANRYELAGGPNTLALLDAMRNGKQLRVHYAGETGARTTDFSLSGLVASLIFVDEVQGRLETVDALQVKGDKPSAVSQIRDIIAISEIPASIRKTFTAPDGTCSFSDEASFGLRGGFEAEVGDGYRLLALPCGEGGAYNQPFVFFVTSDDEYRPLALPIMGDGGPTTADEAWNIDWDQSKKTLTAFFKGRGLGDCGAWDKWVLRSSGDGVAFVLLEARVKDDCDGNYAGGPAKWPAQWPIGK